MNQDLSIIERFLAGLRRRSAALLVAELLTSWLVILWGLVLVAGGLGYLGLQAGWAQSLFWGLVFVLPLYILVNQLLPRHLPLRHSGSCAGVVDSLAPSAEVGVRTALELGQAVRRGGLGGQSADLTAAVVGEVASRLGSFKVSELVPPLGLSRSLVGLLFSLLVFTSTFTFAPEPLAAGLHTFFARPEGVSAPLVAAVPEDTGPPLGDISLTLNYPAYLRREPRVLENATGEFKAPIGTTVMISARVSGEADRAQLVISGQTPATATLEPGGKVSGNFTVTAAGSYHFLLLDGSRSTPTRKYPITLEEDAIPTVEVVGVAEEVELAGGDSLPLVWRARDDFGLTEVAVAISRGGKGDRKVIQTLTDAPDNSEGETTWYPAEWDIPAGESIELWIEVKDNDTVSGPKIGRSRVIKVKIASDDQRHEKTLKAKEALKEALIAVLGDELVWGSTPTSTRTVDQVEAEYHEAVQGMAKVSEGFRLLRDSMEGDAQEDMAVYAALLGTERSVTSTWQELDNATTQAISETRQRGGTGDRVAPTRARVIDTNRQNHITAVERAVLSMESFANVQRLDKIMASGEELRSATDDLRSTLEKLRDQGMEGDLSELLAKVDQVEQKLAQMARQMSELDQSSAEWFQNPSGETKEAQDALAKVRELLKQGKKEEAMKALEEYMSNLEDMMAAMEKMKDEEFGDIREQATKEIGTTIENLEKLEKDQARLAQDTEAHTRMVQEKTGTSPEQLQQEFNRLAEKAKKIQQSVAKAEAAAQPAGMGPVLERNMRQLEESGQMLESALRAGRLSEAMEQARKLQLGSSQAQTEGMRNLPGEAKPNFQAGLSSARRDAAALEDELSQLAGKVAEAMQQGAAQGQGLAQRQGGLQGQASSVGQTLQDYSKDSNYVPGEWGEQVAQAARTMSSAEQKLQQGEMSGAAADQRAAEATLRSVREKMTSARDQLQQQQKGVPRPGQGQPGQRGPGQGQDGMAQGGEGRQPGKGEGKRPTATEDWGGRAPSIGQVEVVQVGAGSERYREELIEGMKGEAPERYKGQVHDYYEKLVK